MLATACRRVNGRKRQEGFSLNSLSIMYDQAPRTKRDAKKPMTKTMQETKPLLFAPFSPSRNRVNLVSNTRIRKNQSIEAQIVFSETAKERKVLDEMTNREGGPYNTSSQSRIVELKKIGQDVIPGDFVALVGPTKEVGVILPYDINRGNSEASTAHGICVAQSNGMIQLWRSSDISLIFPQFIDSQIAQEASDPNLQVGSQGSYEEKFDEFRFKSRAKITRRLRLIERESEMIRQRLTPAFESIILAEETHDLMKEDYIRTPEVARLLVDHPLTLKSKDMEEGEIEPLSPQTLLATHQLLLEHPEIFVIDSIRHRDTQTFLVRTQVDRKAEHQVAKWVQSSFDQISAKQEKEVHQSSKQQEKIINPIDSFCQKAKAVLQRRKSENKRLSANQPGSPRTVESKGASELTWDINDLTIIRALRASIGIPIRVGMETTLSSLSMLIAKRCGKDVELEINQEGEDKDLLGLQSLTLQQLTITHLLMELGFIAPWENLSNMRAEFRQITSDRIPTSSTKAASEVVIDEDENIRKDFVAPVYVIDEGSARELDDGVAIEPTKDQDKYWVHMLIADPTTVVQPGGEIAKEARRRHSSHYHPEGYWPMLPLCTAESLDLRAKKGEANALRFSAKVDITNGRVDDLSVGLARLKNVNTMTYDEVSSIITDTNKETIKGKEDLKLLHHIAVSLERRRREVGGAFVAGGNSISVSLNPPRLPSSPIWGVTEDYCPPIPNFAGFPKIEYGLNKTPLGPKLSLANGMVAELMILAGRIASAWGKDMNLPILHRHQPAPPSQTQREDFLSLRDEDGFISYEQLLRSKTSIASGGTSIEAQEQFSMGIRTHLALTGDLDLLTQSGYARVTSPLRRYSDMVNHWQIKHALRKQPTTANSTPLLNQDMPFSSQELTLEVPRLSRMDAWTRSMDKNSHRFYMHLKLQRGLQARRGEILLSKEEQEEVYPILDDIHEALVSIGEVRISTSLRGGVRVQMTTLGLPAELRWNARTLAPPVGTIIKARISEVLITGYTNALILEPI